MVFKKAQKKIGQNINDKTGTRTGIFCTLMQSLPRKDAMPREKGREQRREKTNATRPRRDSQPSARYGQDRAKQSCHNFILYKHIKEQCSESEFI